jgi:short-subunit dehydrogenase
MQWRDSVAVVTGASRGIGREVAKAAAGKGAKVGLIARHRDDLDVVLREIGGQGAVAVADVGDADQLAAALASLEAQLGPPDILVANAGIGAYGPFADVDPAFLEHLLRVNVLGTMLAIRSVVPGMIERRRGHIVTVSSIAGRFGSPFEAAYSATKFAQIGLSEALAVELSPYGVGVSIVIPGVVDTDFFAARGHLYDRDRPKPIPAADVAKAIVRVVETGKHEQFVPAWFAPTVLVRHALPPLFHWGTKQSFRKELADDEARRG